MLDKILVPIDLSTENELVLNFVVGLKSMGLKDIHLVHVLGVARVSTRPVKDEIQGQVAERLSEIGKIAEENGIGVHNEILEGKVDDEIIDFAEHKNISMIVTGSHGKSAINEILTGSVSEGLARKSKIPILVLHYDYLKKIKKEALYKKAVDLFKKVLITIDFTDVSKVAIDYSSKLVKAGLKEAIILHSIDKKRIESNEEKLKLLQKCKEKTEKYATNLEEAGAAATAICRIGVPLKEIGDLAEEEDVSLIITGSQGKGIFREFASGSVSMKVLRSASRPLMLIQENNKFI